MALSEPSGTPTVSRSVEIAAAPDAVYALITDLESLAELAEETTAMHWTKGSRAEPGAVFSGANRNGVRRWSTRCTVTDAEPGSRFAFEVDLPMLFSKVARWQYDIEATDSGCTVRESTWDRRSSAFAVVGRVATGTADRTAANTAHIDATLQRLKAKAEAAA